MAGANSSEEGALKISLETRRDRISSDCMGSDITWTKSSFAMFIPEADSTSNAWSRSLLPLELLDGPIFAEYESRFGTSVDTSESLAFTISSERTRQLEMKVSFAEGYFANSSDSSKGFISNTAKNLRRKCSNSA